MICQSSDLDISSRRARFPETANVVMSTHVHPPNHDVRGRGKQRTTAGYVQVRTLTDRDLIDYREVEIARLIDLID